MFSYNNIEKFNETEIKIYKFIVGNGEKVPYMTIRELADAIKVSTSTILRFCNKLDCDGYNEFKEKLKKYVCKIQEMPPQSDVTEILNYFNKTNTNSFEQKIEEGANFIRKAETLIFIGSGSSGALAKYAARYFSNLGKFSIGLEDTLYPITKDMKNTVVIALSVSGETKGVINLINQFKINKSNILSITNQSNCTIAQISDWNISYNMNIHEVNGGYNATTQVPALFLIEALSRRI
ncbi:RpiR family transcriptional regulator [Clostridium gelidum]|uniref:RpiR family transcriptional regulator n=1 Tax=Clostridium gelidum TaxID=704125 RepID=A0ABM7TE46_9CLOT|nr:MurR/RpiR family transcriptional regulator [Clostridium gelidum]BCZ49377.1 RpiR family transcriptional regulator [Clostridium gelidum]